MNSSSLRQFHVQLGAHFTKIGEVDVPADYGHESEEYLALWETAGLLDLSFRGRVCVTGADRARFLHGQVTNDVNRLRPGSGCYAALITAKGKMQSDLNLYNLGDELLLDFEPRISPMLVERLEKYVIADDVQVVDISSLYGLFSVQGPKAGLVLSGLEMVREMPGQAFAVVKVTDATFGEIYIVNQPRLRTVGYDIFVPTEAMAAVAEKLVALTKSAGGGICGCQAFETARIEAGIPRFGVDMDETNIPLESGIEDRAISFAKGCYIGQEVISRIKTYGQVTKALRGLILSAGPHALPSRGDKLFHEGKEVGYITSAVASPAIKAHIALGYVRKEVNQIGTTLTVRTSAGEPEAQIVPIPFRKVAD